MFESDINMVIGAIIEMFTLMGNPPELEAQGVGPVLTSYCGNGRWRKTSSNYFNCGVNKTPNVAPAEGEIGHLSWADGENVFDWFQSEYKQYNPDVLKKGTKWNYVMVVNGNAFNFHMQIG